MLHSFARGRSGNFAILSALLALPLVLSAGLALDFTTLSRTRASLQQAMDSAALSIAREGELLTTAQANLIAADFLDENYDRNYTDLRVVRADDGVTVDALTMVPLAFGSLFGYEKWPVLASSTANVAYTAYEVGLVLDTTGSMAGGKLAAMKEAVVGLVDTMSAQVADPGKLKFAVVPFANFVNVGPQHAPKFDKKNKLIKGTGAPWLDLKGKVEVEQLELKGVSRFEAFNNLGQAWAGCVETRHPNKKAAHDTDDTAPKGKGLFVPAFSIDEPDTPAFDNSYIVSAVDPLDKSKAGKAKKLQKYGVPGPLVASIVGLGVGNQDDDDEEEEDSSQAAPTDWQAVETNYTGGKGPNAACSTQPLMPLSNDYAAIKAMVAGLQAGGTTNILEGVAWGARVLSPEEPFTQGSPRTATNVDRIMIVLTDGANVLGNANNSLGSTYSSFGYLVDGRLGIDAGSASDTNALMNARTLEACAHAKADGYTIYTIRLEEPDVKTGTLLSECASSPGHYFDVPTRSKLDEVFSAIRSAIVRVRLAS